MGWFDKALNIVSFGTYDVAKNIYNDLSGENARKANAQNIQLAQEQNDWNLAQWHRENEYNTPVNQMQRLKDAGINPNLAFGGGNYSSVAASSPVAQRANVAPETSQSDALNKLVSSVGLFTKLSSEIGQLNASTKMMEEQADYFKSMEDVNTIQACKLASENEGVKLHNKSQEILNTYLSEQQEAMLTKMQQDVRESKARQALADAQKILVDNNAKAVLEKLPHEINEIRSRIIANYATATNQNAQALLAKAKVSETQENILLLRAQKEKTVVEATEKEITNWMRKHGINPNESSFVQMFLRASFDPVYNEELLKAVNTPAYDVFEGTREFELFTNGSKLIPKIPFLVK